VRENWDFFQLPSGCIVYRALLLVACVSAAVNLQAAEKVENPYFTSWSKQKVGTTVTFTETFHIGKQHQQFQQHTLKEVKDDRLIIETRVLDEKGKVAPDLSGGFPVLKTLTLPDKPGKHAEYAPAEKAEFVGTEKVTVGGKAYEAKKFKQLKSFAGIETQVHYWVSNEVPGLRLKVEEEEKSGTKWVKSRTLVFKEVKAP
jgi:hypothetical protein